MSDAEMPDATGSPVPEPVVEEKRPLRSRLRMLPGSTDTAASFQFEREDHTLGNALRYVIMKNPKVEFCGYTIPHPSEARMNIRIQTWDDHSVYDVLDKAFDDLSDLCDVVTQKFTASRDAYDAAHPKA